MTDRLPVYATSVGDYAAFTIGRDFVTDIGMSIAFRRLAGCACPCMIVLCGGTLADVIDRKSQAKCKFLLFTTFMNVSMNQYGWSVGVSGLGYIGLDIGMFAGVIINEHHLRREDRAITGNGEWSLKTQGSPSTHGAYGTGTSNWHVLVRMER